MPRTSLVISVIIALLALNQFMDCNAKRRWCTDGIFTDELQNMTQYNDEEKVCIKCEKEEKLIDLEELNQHECCAGEVRPVGICPGESVRHSCNTAQKCDNKKQCKDGSDETGCFGCGSNSFSCGSDFEETQCISMEKVCDSEKNCVDGKDETICPYYGGWCDGFLCGDRHQKCIEYSKICDGIKDCVDGSDESNCQYCPNQFRCRTFFRIDNNATSAKCIGMFRVCDGTDDCVNGMDEFGCYAWQEWLAWGGCGTETESCTRIRRRSCVDGENVVVSSSKCIYNESLTNENEIDICPECLDIGNPNTAAATTTVETAVQGRSNGLPFSTGALAGIIVGGSLLFIGVIVAIAIAVLGSLGRTGFWRPAAKLPGPAGSSLPGVRTPNDSRVSPTERITNPYADDIVNGRINGIVSSRNGTVSTTTSIMRTIT